MRLFQRGRRGSAGRFLSVALAAVVGILPLAGCGRSNEVAGTRESFDTRAPGSPQQERQGLSTKQKVAILAGAAALYYLYNRQKNARGEGKTGQYYLSKNGRIYYRDPNNPRRVIWVTPPREGIRVPAEEAQRYSRYQGYNNRETGETFGGYGATAAPVGGGPPGPGAY
jgi:hypothetical protein